MPDSATTAANLYGKQPIGKHSRAFHAGGRTAAFSSGPAASAGGMLADPGYTAQTRHFGPKSVVVLGVVAGIAAVIVYWFMFMSVEVACGMIDGGGKWTQAKGGAITVYLEAGEEQNLGIIGIGGQKPYTCEWTWTGNIEDYDVRYDSSTLKNRSPSARIKFTKAGTRVAKVTVRDSGYRSGTATVTINVVPKGQRPKQ
jgi:hypothetical protein